MIEIKDLKKGLRVVGKDFKGIIVKWDIQPSFVIPQLPLPAIITKPIAHVLLNTNEHWINSIRESDREIMTYGACNKNLDVDLDYYNNLNGTRI